TDTTHPPVTTTGRGYFLAGIAVCLLGLVLVAVQFSLKRLFTPWYSPVLATLGAILLVIAVSRRASIPRLITLILLVAFAGLQWYFLGVITKLPDDEGPARVGRRLAAFRAMRADGQPFTDATLHDGTRRVLVFFRGRW